MKSFFLPAISLMNRLRFASKFAVISLFLIIPFGVSLYLFFSVNNHQIDFNQNERNGVEYNLPLKNFIMYVQDHRDKMDLYLKGNSSIKQDITSLQGKIDAVAKQIDEKDQKLNSALSVEDRWKKAKADWETLKGKAFDLTAEESYKLHTDLINNHLLALHVYVNDKSNLTLDPDLDSYYLMDITMFVQMPYSEKLDKARHEAMALASKGEITFSDKKELTSLTTEIQGLSDRIKGDIDIAVRENKSYLEQPVWKDRADVEPVSKDVEESTGATEAFLEAINGNLIDVDVPGITPEEIKALGNKAIEANFSLYDKASEGLDGILKARVDNYKNNNKIVMTVVIIGIPLVFYFYIAFSLSIIESASIIEQATLKIAEGDLTTKVDIRAKDELGQVGTAYNRMLEALNSTIASNKKLAVEVAATSKELAESVDQSARATEQVTMTMQGMAEGAEIQVRAADKSSQLMEEMAQGVQDIASRASVVSVSTVEAAKEAEQGNVLIKKAVEQMNSINVSVKNLSSVVRALSERSQSIGQTLEIITGIASQTNLLALNAAIEAARAGEHGRGFAVVAEEVRKLAELSAESVHQIATLNKEIQNDTVRAVDAMDEGAKEVNNGIAVINETGEAFQRILKGVRNVADEIQKVSAASQQISASSDEVKSAVVEMNRIARESVASAQSVAATSEEQMGTAENIATLADTMSDMAGNLQKLINTFKV